MEELEAAIVLPGRCSSPTPAVTTPSENGGSGPVVCALCLSAAGKYTCPRCNAPYCSLACYRGARHSACSELFYQESVLQVLREEDGDSRGRRQVEEMLLKLREEEEEEGGLWGSLTRQEKEHFNSLVTSGNIGSLVPQWKPWWDTQQGSKIQELPEDGAPLPTCGQADGTKQTCPTANEEKDHPDQVLCRPEKTEDAQKTAAHVVSDQPKTNSVDSVATDDPRDQSVVSGVPPLLSPIPPLCSLTRRPSPLVPFTLVNVIYGYSFSLLRHNGDLSDGDMMLDFTGTLMSVSGALSTTAVYNSTAHALKSAVRAASDPSLGGDEGVAVLAMEATAKILEDGSKRFSLAALSHLYRLLGKVRRLVTEEKDVRKGAFTAKKKCWFLAAWVNENGEHLAVLSADVLLEYKRYLKDLNEMAEISNGLQRVWGGKRPPAKKKLIQEVN